MNAYITLGTKRYITPSGAWQPVVQKAATVRTTLAGAVDVTYTPAMLYTWEGIIEGPVTPKDSNYGSISDLRTILSTAGEIRFIDHNSVDLYVHAIGPFPEINVIGKWDAPANKTRIQVTLVKSRVYS